MPNLMPIGFFFCYMNESTTWTVVWWYHTTIGTDAERGRLIHSLLFMPTNDAFVPCGLVDHIYIIIVVVSPSIVRLHWR